MDTFTAWFCINEDGDFVVTTYDTEANVGWAQGDIGGEVIRIVKVNLNAECPKIDEVDVTAPDQGAAPTAEAKSA